MKKVMIVEDEELILQGIRYIVNWEEISMEVTAMAHNGREALELYKESPVDIVVTDIEMPFVNGLKLLEEIRKINNRTRCIILSGYDEFEYARTALTLDVEEYILKPIDEEQLYRALLHARNHLDEIDRKSRENREEKISWHRFLEGKLKREEDVFFYDILPKMDENSKLYVALMKIDVKTVEYSDNIYNIQDELQKTSKKIKVIYLTSDLLFLLLYVKKTTENDEMLEFCSEFQNSLESQYGIMSFITLSDSMQNYMDLSDGYRTVSKLQKYCVLEGYGSCIDESYIKNCKFIDVVIDENFLRKTILRKDKDGALNYIEDLFINNLKSEVNIDVVYQMALKIAMILQDIKMEYKLIQSNNLKDLSEIIEKIYQADDILGLKAVFVSEVQNIIQYLHAENSQYTPVVKQLMAEVKKNYKEDMNLKTLSYKYHMNTSYLGQIFQKEVGCSFAQYLSNVKNEIAKDLILNTNMKINEIAKEVGYSDISYFYRKFKQCYGVSPASLRNMKKY